jgi:hypothetical protein
LDWGSAAPFSVGWYAVSDGEFLAPRGAIIKFAEWYGWNGSPNKGLKMSADAVARGVAVRDKDLNAKISYGVADPSIFANNGGPSIAEMMLIANCAWIRGDNARQAGWEQMRRRLAAVDPLLLFHESCEHTLRTLPYAQHDDKNPEDLDTDAEDHALDETRYAIMSRPGVKDKPADAPPPLQFARSMPTFNELMAKTARDRALAENRL